MPAEFEFPYAEVEMWLPLRMGAGGPQAGVQEGIARLRPGLTLSQVQSALEITSRQLEQEDPQARAGLRIVVPPGATISARKYEQTLVFILIAVGLVLLIACADVGSLLLSRAVQRQQEIAIRASLGAAFGRLLRQLLAESFVLAAAGSVAGIVVAHYTVRLLTRQLAAMPVVLPHIQRVAINGRVLLFNAAVCLLLAVLVSVAPVILAFRTDLQDVLRSGRRGNGIRGATRLFSLLIACEAAFAFLLLVGWGLMVRSLIRLQQADHGIHADHVLTMCVPIGSLTQTSPRGKYQTKPGQMAYYAELLERMQRVPGRRLLRWSTTCLCRASTLRHAPTARRRAHLAPYPHRQPAILFRHGYSAGRGPRLFESDITGSRPVAILNEYLARQLFPDRDAVGQTLPAAGTEVPATVVGVVRNSPQMSYEAPPKAELYRPYRQVIFGVFLSTIVVRTSVDPVSLAGALRKVVWAVDPNQPVVKVETMDDIIANSIWRPRFSAWLLFGARGPGPAAHRGRHLQRRFLHQRVAGARSRHPHGARRHPEKHRRRHRAVRPASTHCRPPHRGNYGSLPLPPAGQPPLRDQATDPITYLSAAAVPLAIGAIASARPPGRPPPATLYEPCAWSRSFPRRSPRLRVSASKSPVPIPHPSPICI